jgi:hypothetical protein
MRERKQRNGSAGPENCGLTVHREIQADVFELWIGISRLMARLSGPERRTDAGHRPKRRPDR